jgi:pimeloyl-ACP methyl ester carboxylesterase
MRSYIRREADGPPLLLIHGAGANAAVWDPLARELSSFDVVAPHLPGRCGSEGPPLDRAEDAAAWIDALLRELGCADVIALGHSWGGAIALELALGSPNVRGAVLIASGARLRVHPSIFEGAQRAIESGEPMSVAFAFVSPENAAAYDLAASSTPPIATLADWRGCDAFDRMDALERVRVPVLVATGAADVLTPPKYQRFLAERLPRAQLALIEGAGHMLPWEQPAAFTHLVRAWASGIG